MAEAQNLCNITAATALSLQPDLTFARALYQLTSSDDRLHAIAIETLERAWREQPSHSEALRVLIFELTYRGYLREAHRFAIRFVDQDPLSPVAHYSLGETFVALGEVSDAHAPLQFSLDLDNAFARWFTPALDLIEGRDDNATAKYEQDLVRTGVSDTAWIKELIVGARDPASGLAFLDRQIPLVIASLPKEHAQTWRFNFEIWYLAFGFTDRYFERMIASEPSDTDWTDAQVQYWQGILFGGTQFISHPRFLEVAEMLGMIDIWEQRGPPDFCEAIDDQWVCS